MSGPTHVLVKETDMLSAKSLLQLLSSSIQTMKDQVKTNTALTDQNRIAAAGAIEALTDLHNMILSQLQDSRNEEVFNTGDDHGGKFDA